MKTPFQRVTDALTGGCGCACHTGTGYHTSCDHCATWELPEYGAVQTLRAFINKPSPFARPYDHEAHAALDALLAELASNQETSPS